MPGSVGVVISAHPARGAEILAQRSLERGDDARKVAGADQAAREPVHAVGRRVVGAAVLDQLVQLLLDGR